MKGIIVRTDEKKASILKDDGTFQNIKNKGYDLGQVIEVNNKSTYLTKRIKNLIATAAIFGLIFTSGISAYATPSYYVSIDVNPGILMEVNMFERVIGVKALNEEAKEAIKDLKLKNLDVEDALGQTIKNLAHLGYFYNNEGNLIIASTGRNIEKTEKLLDKLKEKVEEETKEDKIDPEVTIDAVGYDMVQNTRALEEEGIYITPGKYNIITNLLGEEVTLENSEMSVKELMSTYTKVKNEEKDKDKNKDEKVNNGKNTPNMGNPQAGDKAPEIPPGLNKVDKVKETEDQVEEVDEVENDNNTEKPEKPNKPTNPGKGNN